MESEIVDEESRLQGEGCSRASGQRKNKGRKDSKVRKLVGHETKFLADGFKLPKTMRDTLVQKVKRFNLNFVISHQLEAVSYYKDPESLDEVDELIAMVNDMLVAKLRIKRCLECVNYYYSSDIELKRHLKNRKEIEAGGDNFPDTQKTPKMKRIKVDSFLIFHVPYLEIFSYKEC
ncbi:hypothetical protein C1646_753429 [Rhizophagus diaphanus]|nr:hypothetical protein C1646_753429 [Rhizophagus diaphanus] [Rhizophagus sp. MUCL 43196]